MIEILLLIILILYLSAIYSLHRRVAAIEQYLKPLQDQPAQAMGPAARPWHDDAASDMRDRP